MQRLIKIHHIVCEKIQFDIGCLKNEIKLYPYGQFNVQMYTDQGREIKKIATCFEKILKNICTTIQKNIFSSAL